MLLRNIHGKKFVDVSGLVSGDVFQRLGWAGNGNRRHQQRWALDAVVTTNGGPAHVSAERDCDHRTIGSLCKLVGHVSNRDGIGAVIKIETAMGPQWYTVTTASSYLSSSDVRAHFGLGMDSAAKTVEIRWPSGIVQTLRDVTGDRYVTVNEPAASASGATKK